MEYNKRLFDENDVQDVITMIIDRQRDFKETSTLKPFYLKAINTLREILKVEMGIPHLYYKYINQYSEITYENTSKLLLRCKVFFRERKYISKVLVNIIEKDNLMQELRLRVNGMNYEIDDTSEEEDLEKNGQEVV